MSEYNSHSPPNQEPNVKYPDFPSGSPTAHHASAAHSGAAIAHSALAYVAANVQADLANIEPSLAALSTHTHTHTPIQPAPPNPDSQNHNVALNMAGPTALVSQSHSPPDTAAKAKRLNRACDACSKRKVKCDNDRPCKNCRDLEIDCTFDRPTKRRGPPNRVAEESKRRKRLLEETALEDATAGAEVLDAQHFQPFLSVDMIAPYDTVNRFVQLFYTYMYPLFPFPHRQMFEHNFGAVHSMTFLGLVASMLGFVAASFPRMAREVLRDQRDDSLLVQNLHEFITRCVKFVGDTRGSLYLNRPELNVDDAATSFFLGMIGARMEQWPQFRRYLGEAISILDPLSLGKQNGVATGPLVDSELAARIRAAVYSQMRALEPLRDTHGPFIYSLPKLDAFQLPSEEDDSLMFFPDRVVQPDHGRLPVVKGATQIALCYSIMDQYLGVGGIERPQDTNAVRDEFAERLTSTTTDSVTEEMNELQIPEEFVSAPTPDVLAHIHRDVQKVASHVAASSTCLLLADQPEFVGEVAQELATMLKSAPVLAIEPQSQSFFMAMRAMKPALEAVKAADGEYSSYAEFVLTRVDELEKASHVC